jgi:hypothetical protein
VLKRFIFATVIKHKNYSHSYRALTSVVMNKVIGKKISELVDVFNNIRVPLSSKQRESLAKI